MNNAAVNHQNQMIKVLAAYSGAWETASLNFQLSLQVSRNLGHHVLECNHSIRGKRDYIPLPNSTR